MHLKSEFDMDKEKNARKQQHVPRKFKKASKWGELLLTMCANVANEPTKIQAEAYSSFLNGVYHFEQENWQEAYNHFIKSRYAQTSFHLSRTIYEQLSKLGTTEFQEYCRSKVLIFFDPIG